jgi:hypothetical protein
MADWTAARTQARGGFYVILTTIEALLQAKF